MTAPRPPLGAHVSIAGGLPQAIARGTELGCETLQIFVKNNNRWLGRALHDDEVEAFRDARRASAIGPVVAHASYLINLAAVAPVTLERSLDALADELGRCDRLGLDGLVLHPGAHVGAGVAAGLDRVARSLDDVLSRVPQAPPLLLEITAGQGTVLGADLGDLATIFSTCSYPRRLGVCLDTCHAFAAGYALDEPAGYDAFFAEVDRCVGLASVGAIHLNDSLGGLGSRRDRHANLGAGAIGVETFARLVNDPALAHIPMLLETPHGEADARVTADLDLLRTLRAG